MRGRKIDVLGRTACIFSGANRTAKAKYFGTFLREVFLMGAYLGNFEKASSGRRLICDSRLLNFRILKVIYLSLPRILRRHRHTYISKTGEEKNQNPQHLLSPPCPPLGLPPPPPDLTLHHDAKKSKFSSYTFCVGGGGAVSVGWARNKSRDSKMAKYPPPFRHFFVPSPSPPLGYLMTRAHPPSLLAQKR